MSSEKNKVHLLWSFHSNEETANKPKCTIRQVVVRIILAFTDSYGMKVLHSAWDCHKAITYSSLYLSFHEHIMNSGGFMEETIAFCWGVSFPFSCLKWAWLSRHYLSWTEELLNNNWCIRISFLGVAFELSFERKIPTSREAHKLLIASLKSPLPACFHLTLYIKLCPFLSASYYFIACLS